MEMILKEQLWAYISSHNPELMYELQAEYQVTDYLNRQVTQIMPEAEKLLDTGVPVNTVQEICLDKLTSHLKPSKYLFVKSVMEEEFPLDFEALSQSGVLTYEIINMMDCCKDIFETFEFSDETEDNRKLRHAIIGQIHDYLL